MNGLFFYIGLGLGLAVACGLRPYLPTLLAGALSSSGALGVHFASGSYRFLQAGWWLAVVAAVLAVAYALQLQMGGERFAKLLGGAVGAQAVGGGALLFAGTLAAHGDASWPGLIAGAGAAAIAWQCSDAISSGARRRLPDRASREALTVYLDAASLAAAALAALLHPLGYLLAAGAVWLLLRVRSRAEAKYAGLRVLRR